MATDLGYTWKLLYRAVDCLATGAGPIEDRLWEAYYPGPLMSLTEEMVPPQMIPRLHAIHAPFAYLESLDEDEECEFAAAKQVGAETAQRLAKHVLSMFCEVTRIIGVRGADLEKLLDEEQ